MKLWHRILGILFGFCAFITILYAALIPNAMNRQFYAQQFEENLSYLEANVSQQQLNQVIDHVLRYLWGQENDMQLTITYLDNSTGLAFSEREIAHMVDVKLLFVQGRRLTMICFGVGIALLTYFILQRKKIHYSLMTTIRNTLLGILVTFALIGIYAVMNFTQAFVYFHEIFFTNDLWLLNPDDLLIIMLPESLFATIAYQTLLHFFAYLFIGLIVLRFTKKKMLQLHP